MKTPIYDIIGIGIGPFNLGLAALSSEINGIRTLFFDKKESFNWHTGMMLKEARLQVPFHADLVTLANPRSAYSFICYLKARGRLFRFTIREEYFPLRREYNDYCRWVCSCLHNLRFSRCCERIEYAEESGCYRVYFKNLQSGNSEVYHARHVVIGVGSLPNVPAFVNKENENIFHSSQYLQRKNCLKDVRNITLIGSGQSAAEIFSDLLETSFYEGKTLSWFTRSSRFYPMDYSKFALEMTSPDYINYFFRLKAPVKAGLLAKQSVLYKGINGSLIESIYNRLYSLSLEDGFDRRVRLKANCRLLDVAEKSNQVLCTFRQEQTEQNFEHGTNALILATGYRYDTPAFVEPVRNRICWDDKGRYAVKRNYSIDTGDSLFVQNAELHTHGFNTPDLGMGPYRNAVILNTILATEHFSMEKNVPFQTF